MSYEVICIMRWLHTPQHVPGKVSVRHSLDEAIATDENVQFRAHKGLGQGAKQASIVGVYANGQSPPYLILILKDPHWGFHCAQEPIQPLACEVP